MQLRPHQNEALAKMRLRRKGQVIVPTGGGKTMCMIEDTKRRFAQDSLPKTIVVVAPRIFTCESVVIRVFRVHHRCRGYSCS